MPQEARDFEILRAELDARMQELVEESPNAPPRAIAGPDETLERQPASPRVDPLEAARAASLPPEEGFLTLEEVERRHIVAVLEARNWRVSGPRGAALILGLNPSTLRSRMKKLGISRDISRKSEI